MMLSSTAALTEQKGQPPRTMDGVLRRLCRSRLTRADVFIDQDIADAAQVPNPITLNLFGNLNGGLTARCGLFNQNHDRVPYSSRPEWKRARGDMRARKQLVSDVWVGIGPEDVQSDHLETLGEYARNHEETISGWYQRKQISPLYWVDYLKHVDVFDEVGLLLQGADPRIDAEELCGSEKDIVAVWKPAKAAKAENGTVKLKPKAKTEKLQSKLGR